MVKYTIIFTCFIFFAVCGEKNIFPNLTNSQEREPFFWPLGAGAAAGVAWEKNQEPEPLEKMSGARAGAAKKLARSQALLCTYLLYTHLFMN